MKVRQTCFGIRRKRADGQDFLIHSSGARVADVDGTMHHGFVGERCLIMACACGRWPRTTHWSVVAGQEHEQVLALCAFDCDIAVSGYNR